jgi:RND family efflux transporter MFP subunit
MITALPLVLVAMVVGAWLARPGAQSKESASGAEEVRTPSISTVQVIKPKPGGIARTIQQPASINAYETVDLYAMVSGYLKSQSVDIGSRIQKGQVLAEIDVPRDAKAVEEAVSQVEQARARVEQAEALIKVAEAQRDAAEATVNQAASDVDRMKAERVLAEKQLARVSGLAAERAADLRLVDEHQKTLDAARAAERTAEIAVRTAKARALAAAAEVQKTRVDAVAAKASLRVTEANRDRLKVNLEYAKIIAPFDGVVTHRTFHPGALVNSAVGGGGQPLLTVKRTDLMRVVVLVPDRDVVWTKVGSIGTVSVDALEGRSFEGTLARIARAENAERMMRVEIDLPNPGMLLFDGMYGKATILLERDTKNLTVPPSCVVEHRGRDHGIVYVVRDGHACRTEVTLGSNNGSLVEIRSGVGPDDPVISHAATPVEDGVRVTASAEDAEA